MLLFYVSGNGPSGICLSYMLSGYWPYYTGAQHPNQYLQARLEDEGEDKSIIEQVRSHKTPLLSLTFYRIQYNVTKQSNNTI